MDNLRDIFNGHRLELGFVTEYGSAITGVGCSCGWKADNFRDQAAYTEHLFIMTRLEYLRSQIEAECISYSEVLELQRLAPYIEPGDTQLREWAGVPEFEDDSQE